MTVENIRPVEYVVDPNKYVVFTNDCAKNRLSVVIVEDEPGPYREFLRQVAEEGRCTLAMSAPFTDFTLDLLAGREQVLPESVAGVRVRIPDPGQTVVILDMRNEAEDQVFRGYNPAQFEIAGAQFKRSLRGFPGKIFFATRYGRDHLRQLGLDRAYGVVTLKVKSGHRGTLPAEDREDLLSALAHVCYDCDLSQVNRAVVNGRILELTFHGQITTLVLNDPERLLLAVLKAGPAGISDADLAREIGYQSKSPTEGAADVPGTDVARDDDLSVGRPVEMIHSEERELDKQRYLFLKEELKKRQDIREGKMRQIAELKARAAAALAPFEKKIKKLLGQDMTLAALDRTDDPSMVEADRALVFQIQSDAQDALTPIEGELAKLTREVDDFGEEISDLGAQRDDAFRRGFKSRGAGRGKWVVASRESPMAGYMRRLGKRLLADLESRPKVPPKELIAHLESHLLRQGGMYRYTSDEIWQLG